MQASKISSGELEPEEYKISESPSYLFTLKGSMAYYSLHQWLQRAAQRKLLILQRLEKYPLSQAILCREHLFSECRAHMSLQQNY